MSQCRAPRRRIVSTLVAIAVGLGITLAGFTGAQPAAAATSVVSWKIYSDGPEPTVVYQGSKEAVVGVSFIGNYSRSARSVPGVAPVKLKPGQRHTFAVYLPASDSSGIFWVTVNGKPIGSTRAYKYGNKKPPTSPRVGYGTKQVTFANANKYKAKVTYRVNGGAKQTIKLAKGQVVVLGLPTGKTLSFKSYVLKGGKWKKADDGTVRVR